MWVRTIMNDAKKNEKGPKSGNMAQAIEIFALVPASVFLSVAASALFGDLAGALCGVLAAALFACALFLMFPALLRLGAAAASAAISFFIAYSICGNIVNALAGAMYIAAGALVYLGVKGKRPRTKITVTLACFLAMCHIGLIALHFLTKTGAFSIEMVSSAVDAGLSEGAHLAASRIPAFSAIPDADSAAYMQELVKNTKAMVPALFALYNLFAAYLLASFFRCAYNILIPMANPGRKKIKNKYWRLNISAVSAIAAIVSILASFFVPSQKYPLPSIVLANLAYILAPGFFVVGIYFMHDKVFKEKSGIFSIVLAAGALTAAMVLPALLPALALALVISGLCATLAGDVKKLVEKAKKALLGDRGDDDDDDDCID